MRYKPSRLKQKKSTLECLLRESLSQLGECKKQFGGVLSETAQTVKPIEQKLATSETDRQITNSNQPLLYADAIKKTLDERDYDSKAQETIVLYNIPESSTPMKIQMCKLFEKLKIAPSRIKNLSRLGKFKPESTARPRPVEIQLTSSYDRRITLSNAFLLKGTKIFVKPKLSWKDRIKEKDLLSKRYELIQLGLNRDSLSIRDLKLFHNGVHIDPGEMDNLSILYEKLKNNTTIQNTTH